MNIGIDITKLSLKKAKEFYIIHWGKMFHVPEDSEQYQVSWDVVRELEKVYKFGPIDLRGLILQARVRAGIKKQRST